MNYVSIIYENPKSDEYGYVLLENNCGEFKFNSNNFEKDWFNCMKKIILDYHDQPVRFSSTVNHFIFDGAPYRSAYLVMNNGSYTLSYDSKDYKSIELFIKDGYQPTWEELKEKYS